MRLSDFLTTKKVIFKDGIVSVVNNLKDGDIEFYELTTDTVFKIKENIIDKLHEGYTEEKCMYDIIPFICNIDRDVDLEKFIQMVNSPSLQFTYIIEGLIKATTTILNLSQRTVELTDELNKIKDENPQMFYVEETKEEKIIRLTNEMNNEKDTKKKREIFLKIAKLYEEVYK